MKNITKILTDCINKDPAQAKILYESYYGYAFKVVFRYVYRYETAVDVVNDGFVKAFTKFHLFRLSNDADNEKLFLGWLKRIMINTAIDTLRQDQMSPEIGGISEDSWDIADKTQNADNLLLYKDLIILIKELPPEYRIVFNLYVIEGYKHEEIAGMLTIPVATSKSRLSKAKALIQKKMKKIEDLVICSI